MPSEGGGARARPRWAMRWLAAIVSWLALWLAFYPADLPLFGWIALVPWLAARRLAGPRAMLWPTLVGIYVHHCLRLTWVGEIAWEPVLGIPLFGVPGALLAHYALRLAADHWRLPLVWAAPLALVTADLGLELMLGLGWTSVGYSQWRWLEGVQSAAWLRVFAVSALVYAVNGWLADAFVAWRRGEGGASLVRPLVGRAAWIALVATALHVHGALRLQAEFEPGPRAVAIQPNIPQENRSFIPRDEIWAKHFAAWRRHGPKDYDPDLMVTPETTFLPVYGGRRQTDLPALLGYPIDLPSGRRVPAGALLPRGRGQISVLGYIRRERVPPGAEHLDEDGDGWDDWNVAGVIEDGRELVGESAKRVLVPLGESLPGRGWLPGREWLKRKVKEVAGQVNDLRAGSGPRQLFTIDVPRGQWTFGTNICYEMVFFEEFRELASEEPDFLINISNDGWYRTSSELDLVHVAARFRAIETGRSLFRVSNTGISTLVDPHGRYRDTVEQAGRRKAVEGVLKGEIPIATGTTIWVRYGHWPLLGLLALAWVLAARGRSGRRSADRV